MNIDNDSNFSKPSNGQVTAYPSGPASNPDTPPHPLDNKWHLHINGQTYGPYTGHTIKEYISEGRVTPNSQVLLIGTEKWTNAAEDPLISSLLREQQKPSPPPISAAAGSTVVQVTNQIQTPNLFAGLEVASAKSPGVALLLSILICGAGQMYNGQVGKGILMFFACVFLWLIFLGWIISIWSLIDAYQTAKRMNLAYMRQVSMGGPI
ncbi:GYF domain-containing protein [Methylobacterium sp. Leaf85]|uniref:GYF domain-containing protein n=1 Tax=Methylobacterium sp. Leaf85 TaxID=1736241 RepID=UPI0012E86AD5|nr:GYF domain-containing protein [Methylobacterium sp. Leaf85]